jgi:hypothetical protein
MRAPLRIAEGQVTQLQDENNQLATSVASLNRRVFELESRLAQRHANQAVADWLALKTLIAVACATHRDNASLGKHP